jgi:hypothetical protein
MLAQPAFMEEQWDGKVRVIDQGRTPPWGEEPASSCPAWEKLTGDAGWARLVAEVFHRDPEGPVYFLFEPGMDLLPLVREAIIALPAERRWEVTFSTYYATLPQGVRCAWRAVPRDSAEAKLARRASAALVLDLAADLGPASGVIAARLLCGLQSRAAAKRPPIEDPEPATVYSSPSLAPSANPTDAWPPRPTLRPTADETGAGPPALPPARAGAGKGWLLGLVAGLMAGVLLMGLGVGAAITAGIIHLPPDPGGDRAASDRAKQSNDSVDLHVLQDKIDNLTKVLAQKDTETQTLRARNEQLSASNLRDLRSVIETAKVLLGDTVLPVLTCTLRQAIAATIASLPRKAPEDRGAREAGAQAERQQQNSNASLPPAPSKWETSIPISLESLREKASRGRLTAEDKKNYYAQINGLRVELDEIERAAQSNVVRCYHQLPLQNLPSEPAHEVNRILDNHMGNNDWNLDLVDLQSQFGEFELRQEKQINELIVSLVHKSGKMPRKALASFRISDGKFIFSWKLWGENDEKYRRAIRNALLKISPATNSQSAIFVGLMRRPASQWTAPFELKWTKRKGDVVARTHAQGLLNVILKRHPEEIPNHGYQLREVCCEIDKQVRTLRSESESESVRWDDKMRLWLTQDDDRTVSVHAEWQGDGSPPKVYINSLAISTMIGKHCVDLWQLERP